MQHTEYRAQSTESTEHRAQMSTEYRLQSTEYRAQRVQNTDRVQSTEKVSTERQFLGSCIGHNAYIGAKVLIMPGRSVPNDAFVAMRSDELISTIPPDMPAGVPHMRDGGTLVPIK